MKLDAWWYVKRLDFHLPLVEFSNPLKKLGILLRKILPADLGIMMLLWNNGSAPLEPRQHGRAAR